MSNVCLNLLHVFLLDKDAQISPHREGGLLFGCVLSLSLVMRHLLADCSIQLLSLFKVTHGLTH